MMTLGIVIAGLPATSASAAAGGVITGTVAFHETSPVRTLQVFTENSEGTYTEDQTLRTTIAPNGSYSAQVPADTQVKLRVSFGAPTYGYWYGDVFDESAATPVAAAAGETVPDVDLEVPVPVSYSGRLLDRGGRPVAGAVIPTANTSGASLPVASAPIQVGDDGEYQVYLPARAGGSWYEDGILGVDNDGVQTWLGPDAQTPGGDGSEPNWYLNPLPGETHTGQDIVLPIGSSSSVVTPPAKQPATATKFRATHSPVVRGTTRKGALLRTTSGRFTYRPTTVRYQWLRNGHAIRGAHSSAYRLKKVDVRKRISVRVTATRSGSRVLATSVRTRAITAH